MRLQGHRIVSYDKLYIPLQIWREAAVEQECLSAITNNDSSAPEKLISRGRDGGQ